MRLALALVVVAVTGLAISCTDSPTQPPDTFTPQASPVAVTTTPVPNSLETKRGVLTLANRGDPPAGFDPFRTSSIAEGAAATSSCAAVRTTTRCAPTVPRLRQLLALL